MWRAEQSSLATSSSLDGSIDQLPPPPLSSAAHALVLVVSFSFLPPSHIRIFALAPQRVGGWRNKKRAKGEERRRVGARKGKEVEMTGVLYTQRVTDGV